MGSTKDFESLVYYLATLHWEGVDRYNQVTKILEDSPEMVFWKLRYSFCVRCRQSMIPFDAIMCLSCGGQQRFFIESIFYIS